MTESTHDTKTDSHSADALAYGEKKLAHREGVVGPMTDAHERAALVLKLADDYSAPNDAAGFPSLAQLLPKRDPNAVPTPDPMDVPVKCDICNDIGFVRTTDNIDDPKFGKAQRCTCNVESTASRLARSCIPVRYLDAPMATGPVGDAMARWLAMPWAERPSFVLSGPPGSGKTSIACAVLRSLIDAGDEPFGMFANVTDMLNDIKARYDQSPRDNDGRQVTDSAAEYETKLARVPILVLDDLGAERATDWALDRLYTLINARLARGVPTIFTTNEDSPHGLFKVLNSRIADRVQASAWIVVDRDSYRREQGATATMELTGSNPAWWSR